MSRTRPFFYLLIVLALTPGLAAAQTPPATGTPPFGSFGGSPDVINLANLNAHWTIPVLHKPGRGTNFTYDLTYDSSVWYPVTSNGTTTWQSVQNWGWSAQTQGSTGFLEYSLTQTCNGSCTLTWSNYVYFDAFGTSHQFTGTITGQAGGGQGGGWTSGGGNFTSLAADGSGYTLYASVTAGSGSFTTVNTLTTSSGVVTYPPSSYSQYPPTYPIQVTDRNGNQITTDGSGHFYDTLSSSTPVLTVAGTAPSNTTFTYTAPSGAPAIYTMKYTNYTVATNFAVFGINEYKSSAAVPLVSSIELPDGTQYSFLYEATPSTPPSGACTAYSGTSCVTGRIKSVTLPTGGQITYAYSGGAGSNGSGIFSDGSAATLARTTPDGTWSYAQTKGTGAASATLITAPKLSYDPAANQSILQFQGIYQTQLDAYQGSAPAFTSVPIAESTLQTANLLQEAQTCYASTSPCTGTAVTLPISYRSVITALPAPGATTLESKQVTDYNIVGTPTEVDAYGFGSGVVGALINKTLITYASLGNITAFQQTVTVQNASGTLLAQTNYNYDETTPTSAPTGTPQLTTAPSSRGNLTSVQNCTFLSYCGSYLKSTMTYDTAGQLQTSTDPSQNTTSFSYTDNYFVDSGSSPSNPPSTYTPSAPTDAFVTAVTLPVSGTMTYGYYIYSGQQAVVTDQNGNSSYSHFQDSLSRKTSSFGPPVPVPNSQTLYRPWTLAVYASTDTQADRYLGIGDTTASASCSSCRHDEVLLDGLGRTTTQELVSDPEGATTTATNYDPVGRLKNMSHPYRSTTDSTYGVETPTYDRLGRAIKLTHQDNTYSQTFFGASVTGAGVNTTQLCSSTTYGLGYPTLFIDEASKRREVWTDGLGRTIEADEPDSSGNLTSATCYTYDPLGNLTQTAHGAQTRSYAFDAISRVTSVTIPELANSAGTNCSVTYTYDNNSNVQTKVSPAPNQTSCTSTVTITFSHDALNRLTKKTYSDGSPTVQYGYDGVALTGCSTTPPTLTDANPKGQKTSMCDASGATSWAHDATGKILTETRTILGVTKTLSYVYNLDGSIATVTYPSSNVVTYTASNAQRLTVAKDVANNVQFATAASYAAPGGLQGMITGQISGGFGGITESHTYNNSVEYTSTQATSSAGTAMNLTVNYNLPGGDNGTVTSITNNVDNGRTASFLYDPLNRIASATSQATSGADCWGENFTLDAVANLNTVNVAQCTGYMLSVTVDVNNHINSSSSFAYDAVGNLTLDGTGGSSTYSYTFDDENHLTLASGMSGGPYCYVYDGNGLRVAKKSGATTCSSGTVTKLYWRSITGDAIAETDSSGGTTNSAYNEYVFFAGRRIAQRTGPGAIFYYFADYLGTTRTITTGSGPSQTPGQLCYDADYTPYGQEISYTGRLQTTACPSNYKFTGYEYDPETGNYYAFARYYSYRLRRFLSTDLLGGSVGNLQSHNAYAYSTNNPTNLIDPSGLLTGSGNGDPGPIYLPDFPCDFASFDISGLTDEYDEGLTCSSTGAGGSIFGNGAGGGGVDTKALDICTKLLFGVALESFTAAQGGQPGTASDGSFTGLMSGVYQGFGKPLAPGPSRLTVTTDVSMNVNQVTAVWNFAIADYNLKYEMNYRQAAPGGVGGFTPPRSPLTNYAGYDGGNVVGTQIWELGNSLSFISGQQMQLLSQSGLNNTSYEAGAKLYNCYIFLRSN
jgi:RHS repeat-associated protein